jgi:hypothetical protein
MAVKWITRLLVALLALVAVAVAVAFFYVDRIVGAAIERGASQALGVETRVGFVRILPLQGLVKISSLKVRNPPGDFDETYLLAFDDLRAEVDVGTLREDVVVAPDFSIDGVEVSLEKAGGQTNYGIVLANLKRFEKSGAKPPPAEPAGPKRRIVVKQLVIRDLLAHYEHTDRIGKLGKIDVEVPEIRLENVGSDNARGVAMDELTNIIVKSVFTAIARNGAALPDWLVGDMLGDLRGLGAIPLEIVGGTANTVLDALPAPAADAARELGAKAGEALDGLGGLFGGKKSGSE